jgi:prevent-host-death family protein
MRTDVDVNELPKRLNEVLALASAGQEIVVVANGTPRARLLPVESNPPQAFSILDRPRPIGLRPGAIILPPDFNDPLPDEFWTGEE